MLKRFSSTFKGRKRDGKSAASGPIKEIPETNDAGPVVSLPAHAPNRAEVESCFSEFANVVCTPLPDRSGGGSHEETELSKLWADFSSIGAKHGIKDTKTLIEVVKNAASGADVDDKTMLMERVIQVSGPPRCGRENGAPSNPQPQLVAALPPQSKVRSDLTIAFVNQLWGSLQHPPQSYIGSKFQYRSGDGSG
jgi:linoleate 10R-lipoxygenase